MPAVDWLESDNPTILVRKIVTNSYLAAIDTPPSTRPVNTVPPVLDNANPKQGDTITADEGSWTNAPTSFSWLWYRNGSSTGVTTEDYTLTLADVGKEMKRRTVAHNADGDSFPVFSDTSAPVFALIYSGGTVDVSGWAATPDTLIYDGHNVYIDPFATGLNILQTVDGDLDITSLSTTLSSLNAGIGVLNSFNAQNCAQLSEVYVFTESVSISGCSSASSIFIQSCEDASISLEGCSGVNFLVHLSNWPNITFIDYTPCVNASNVYASDCPLLTDVDLTGLSSVDTLNLFNCGLTAIPDFSDCTIITNLDFDGNAIIESEVDGLLAYLVAINFIGSVTIKGGTNSPPSAAGLANKAILEGNGCTVEVNS